MKRRLIGLGIAASAALLLAGCSGTGSPAPVATLDDESLVNALPPAAAGVDHVTWNISLGEPNSLDPVRPGLANQPVQVNLCESMLIVNDDGTTSPNWAEVTQTDDTTVEVEMRKGVTFWDGTEATADDAIFSLERFLDPVTGANFTGQRNIESVEKTGDYSYTIHLSQPDANLMNVLANPIGVLVQKAFTESAGDSFGKPDGGLMCTGPYKLDKWNVGQNIQVSKYADYWNKDKAALIENVTFTFNTDAASTAAAMSNGEIEGAYTFPLSILPQLEAGSGTVAYGPGNAFHILHFINIDEGPLADVRLRQALAYAIDYEGIIDGIELGTATVNKTLTGQSGWSYAEDTFKEAWDELPAGTQDLDKANELIAEAGAPTEPFVFAYSQDRPDDVQMAAVIENAAKSIGLPIKMHPLPAAQYSPIHFNKDARTGIDMMLWNGYYDLPAEPAARYQFYKSDAVFNLANIIDPDFDALADEAISTLDPKKRAELVTELQQYMIDNQLIIPIDSMKTRVWVAEGLTGVPVNGTQYYTAWLNRLGAAE